MKRLWKWLFPDVKVIGGPPFDPSDPHFHRRFDTVVDEKELALIEENVAIILFNGIFKAMYNKERFQDVLKPWNDPIIIKASKIATKELLKDSDFMAALSKWRQIND